MLLAGSLALIVAATTMPWSWYYVGHSHWAAVEWVPFSKRFRPDDLILNVLLFVPFGFTAVRAVAGNAAAATTAGVNPSRSGRTSPSTRAIVGTVVAGCLVSIGVEWFQVYCHGRMPTSVDVIANTLGTWIGTRTARPRQGR